VTALAYNAEFATKLRQTAARPTKALRILTAADAALAVRHAIDEGLDVALGDEPLDRALVLDLSGMRRIVIDLRNCTVRAQPGVTARELHAAAGNHGLAPAGLVAAELVTRAGSIVRASEETPELLHLVRTRTLRGFVVDSTYRLYDAGR
jgi:FAD/FMN-containing dehydrogenase